jgi:hypothetical protein
MADQRAFARRFQKDLSETPKLLRSGGEAEVERSAMFMGIPYDPGLVGPTDLSVFSSTAFTHYVKDQVKEQHLLRLIRHAERVRSHATWPDYLNDHFVSVRKEPIEVALERLTPGSRAFMKRISALKKKLGPDKFHGTKWGKWLREWNRERRRVEELGRGKRCELATFNVYKKRDRYRVARDPLGLKFKDRDEAVAWGRHLAGGGKGTYDELQRIRGKAGQ